MKTTFIAFLATSLCTSLVAASPFPHGAAHTTPRSTGLATRASCDNTATSRDCWGDYSIDTNYYETTVTTGVTREYWLTVENISTSAADGYTRYVQAFNGTIPGPAIIADWGDDVIVHVTNNMEYNGTTVHWHGIRQLNNSQYDGVPGVTQCPIAPGDTLTYKFHAEQYGSSWYHSHLGLQYGNGVFGPLQINGPATADYDEDLGLLFLSDWSHIPADALWDTAKLGGPPTLENTLINGTNTFDCSTSTDANCVGGGKKWETTFVSGTKYLIRLVNSAVDAHMQFSIDGHTLTVIATDFVPIVPYTTDSVLVSIGQRYDVIVEANAATADYWLRGGWVTTCSANDNVANMTGIIRYDASSTADPVSVSTVTASTDCGDEDVSDLVPYLALDVGTYAGVISEDLSFAFGSSFTWTLNTSTLLLDWTQPTNLLIYDNATIWPTPYNVIPIDISGDNNWVVFVIEDLTGIGLTHPIHLHGHDFWVIGQSSDVYNPATATFNLVNPPRRDVASLPGNGYLAIAFKLDNPGSWLMHCHIAWHASEGFGLQFVETESAIAATITDASVFTDTCSAWVDYTSSEVFPQEDSGI